MFEKIKQFGRNFTQSTPFILANTVIFIPYDGIVFDPQYSFRSR